MRRIRSSPSCQPNDARLWSPRASRRIAIGSTSHCRANARRFSSMSSRHFSPHARIQAMLDVEAALADAETLNAIIPGEAAIAIRAAAKADLYDLAAIESEAERAGNLAIPLVRHLTSRVASTAADMARYVHWGATSQDIIDTGLVLQVRESVPVIVRDLSRAADAA